MSEAPDETSESPCAPRAWRDFIVSSARSLVLQGQTATPPPQAPSLPYRAPTAQHAPARKSDYGSSRIRTRDGREVRHERPGVGAATLWFMRPEWCSSVLPLLHRPKQQVPRGQYRRRGPRERTQAWVGVSCCVARCLRCYCLGYLHASAHRSDSQQCLVKWSFRVFGYRCEVLVGAASWTEIVRRCLRKTESPC